ncbi:zinc finger and BTB domain-containing protein 24 [Salarias fasciatus]|uniref:Zinc finger and BTB domain containing 24 n=1 Tax=Salarias fasciatus TaxID=181472 RepID=A0A672GD32_SALFA|nr:zinc finger and BTB domain-containing protein 24 [Salarias fasciatus]XP_029972833.1 zinc finger and BTB domain-containing protein 24 [Salarias fasciatus]
MKMSQQSTNPTSSLLVLRSESHNQSILSKFDHLRKRDLLCDVTLVVEDMHFKAHRALLAASSEYFTLMFAAGPQEGQDLQAFYQLDGVAAQTFAAVLEFIYSSQVSVDQSSTQHLLAAARLLEVSDLVDMLTDLTAAEVRGHAGDVGVLKPKRGRPKKDAGVPDPKLRGQAAQSESSEDGILGDLVETQITDDADFNPEEHNSRQSKRKIRPPVKYKGYKVGKDVAVSKETGKRGRKKKYPNTEPRCEECGKVFKNHPFLKIHQRTHTGEKPFQCTDCGKSFTQKHTLLDHQRMHTGEKPFVCSVCSKALSTKHSLQEHMNLHREEKSFDCDKCGKSFTQKRQLKSHYRVHSGKSLPECAQCHRKFMDTAQLKKHVRTHTGEKPFTCDICGKCFTVKSTLQTHIRIHRGEKPYNCNICNKSFSDPSARRRHVASHSGKKPFTCSFCSLSFTRLDNLKTHTKSHSKERAAPAEASSEETAAADAPAQHEEVRNLLQLQQYQLPPGSGQEIQLVVTADVDNINFVQAQEQEISLISTEGEAAPSAQSRLTLLTPPSGHLQNVALVTEGEVVDPQIHAIGMLEGPLSQPSEQMHVITLSKEAMEQLQVQHGPPQPLQLAQRAVQQLQVMHQPVQQVALAQESPAGQVGRGQHGRAIHISSQSSQPISISQTSEQLSGHHIQGQTFQIQAGTVSYLYTTGLPQDS